MPDELQASQYARRLATHWRALLDTSEELENDILEHGSLLFRPRPCLASTPELPSGRRPGDLLGEFELVRLIGKGSMGHVWEAQQPHLDRTVALKLIRPDRLSTGMRVLFGREGRAAARLRHPAIVTVFAMGEADGTPWIAQEFVDGECTLADFLAEIDRGQLPHDYDRRIALFFFQLAEALAYAHGSNVMHRDLKPANVLVGEGDRPKLTDFGLAELEEDDPTAQPLIAGTPSYMSPEQASGGALGRHSDVFSLGTMLYEALTLKLPFTGSSVPDVLAAVVGKAPIPCRAHRPSISADLAAVVARALEKRPADRYASMQAFAADLAAFLDGRSVAARPIGIVPRAWRWARRHRSAAAQGLAALALLTVSIFAVMQAAHETLLERVDKALLQADAAIERDDHVGAQAALDHADALIPGRPDIPLRRAAAFLRSGRLRAAADAAKEARTRGYDLAAPLGDDATRHYLRAIYLLTMEGNCAFVEAEALLEQALRLAPEKRSPWYLLYKLYRTADRHEDAIAALEQFKRGIRRGHVLGDIVDAQILDLQGDPAGAVDILDRLAREHALDPSPLAGSDFYALYGVLELSDWALGEPAERDPTRPSIQDRIQEGRLVRRD